jgi:hypothetical protein
LINNGLQAIKLELRNAIREGETAVSVDAVTEELDKLTNISEEDMRKIIFSFEDLESKDEEAAEFIFQQLKPSYESLLQVSYL